MYRRRTVEALLRHHERQQGLLLAVIREQNDRLMLLAGRQYAPTPLDVAFVGELARDEYVPVEVGQQPDGLGDPW